MKPASARPMQGSRTPSGRFKPGASGNPAGKPRGAQNVTTRVATALLAGEAEALARKVIDLALAGDVVALRVCIERLIPVARERSIEVEMPTLTTASDLPAAVSRLLALVAAGEITPTEGERLAGLLGAWRSAVELTELENRIAALEGKT